MKCSLLWKNKQHVLCATEVMLRVQDMMWHMLLNGQLGRTKRHQNSTGTGSQNPSCSALRKIWPPVTSDRSIDANSYAVASHLIIVGETKPKSDWRPGSTNNTMHIVKEHPSNNQYVHSYVRYFIHITVSSTLRLTYRTNHQHRHKENLMEFIYCSVRPLGYTFIYRMKWSALH